MEFLDKVIAFFGTLEGQSVVVAMALEFVFRLVKTEKPKSIAYFVADLCKKAGAAFGKAGEFLDKVLPQRVK
jgi:hypothetical protein